jgi:hypothetical protein
MTHRLLHPPAGSLRTLRTLDRSPGACLLLNFRAGKIRLIAPLGIGTPNEGPLQMCAQALKHLRTSSPAPALPDFSAICYLPADTEPE